MTDILLPKNALTVTRGTSMTLRLTVTDPSTNKPVDLTGGRVVLTVKGRVEDSVPLIMKTTDVELQAAITQPTAGIAEIYLVPTDTERKTIKQYVFDVWVVLANGKRYAVIPPSIFDLQAGVTVLS